MQSITPPLIAVIGSDGSGKSTVCEHLITVVEKYGAAERVHLGKQAGNVGRSVTKLPLMGKSLHKTIERNQVKTAKIARTSSGAGNYSVCRPSLTALSSYACLSSSRVNCSNRPLSLRTKFLALTMVQCSHLTLKVVVLSHGWQARNVKRFTGWRAINLIWSSNSMLTFEVACARKPDHKRESLARKIAITPQLTFGGAQLVDIDANQPLEKVLIDAEKAITDFMTARGYH